MHTHQLLRRTTILLVGFTAALTGVAQGAVPPAPAVGKTYNVTVHTGNRSGAGTDSNVYLRLYGTHGVSPEVQLDNAVDNFERNQLDEFQFRLTDLGTRTKACVRFDRLGGDDAEWYADWVDVTGEFFQFYRWFGSDQIACRNA